MNLIQAMDRLEMAWEVLEKAPPTWKFSSPSGAWRQPHERVFAEELGDEESRLFGPHVNAATLLATAMLQTPGGETELRAFLRHLRQSLGEIPSKLYENEIRLAETQENAAAASLARAGAEDRAAATSTARADAHARCQADVTTLSAELNESRRVLACERMASDKERALLQARLSQEEERTQVERRRRSQQRVCEHNDWQSSVARGKAALSAGEHRLRWLATEQTRLSEELDFAWKLYADQKTQVCKLVDAVKRSEDKTRVLQDAEQIFIDSLAAGNPWTTARVAATNAEMRQMPLIGQSF
jgi:hypothetical protein